ncbi:unnamed protein product [Phytomonas sp. Hart1]|nr:unnamed protein product [Phytomonas sp. Hart1]|eukprot:CCW69518.1 unnamed protein product [Phytomonas sp. isolate Hart1]
MLVFFITFLPITLSAILFVYIMVVGSSPHQRNSIIGKSYEKLVRVPVICGVASFSLCYFGNQQKGREAYEKWWDRTSKYREWFLVLFYIALVWPIEYLYLLHALPELRASTLSKALSWVLVLSSEVFYALAVFTNPGKVTPRLEREKQTECLSHSRNAIPTKRKRESRSPQKTKNGKANSIEPFKTLHHHTQKHFGRGWRLFSLRKEDEYVLNQHYAIDEIIYPSSAYYIPKGDTEPRKEPCKDPGNFTITGLTCPTCCIPRPSRSKHCRYCDICVRRFDHHCPWINNDVAEGTHRYFMAFLFLHTISCLWASSDLFRCIKQFLLQHNAWGWKLRFSNGETIPIRFIDYAKVLAFLQTRNVFLFCFGNAMSVFLYCFFIYNLRFVIQNVTINDLNKMEDLADFVTELPTLDLVYQEAMRYCQRLEKVALRKPRALYKLPKPPHRCEPGYEEGGKKNKKYRDNARKLLLTDLRGLFDRGVWNNLKEVLFPYKGLNEARVSATQHTESLFS